jgi:hypothetical protein
MKKANALLAIASSSPTGDGASICCTMLGAAASSVRPAHRRTSSGAASRDFHLTATDVAHHQLAR